MEASRPGIPATQPAGPGKAQGAQATSHGPLGTDQPLKAEAEAEAATLSVLFPPGSGDVSSEVASPGICEKHTFPGPPQLKGSNLGVGSAPPPRPPRHLDTEPGSRWAFKRLYWGNVQGWGPSSETSPDAVLHLAGQLPSPGAPAQKHLTWGQEESEGGWTGGGLPTPCRGPPPGPSLETTAPSPPGTSGNHPCRPLRVSRPESHSHFANPHLSEGPSPTPAGATHQFWQGPRL